MRERIRRGGQIMKNKSKFIPLLLLCPLLFMGNSPAPYDGGDVYEDFEVSNLTYGEKDIDDKYPLTIDVKNTGTGYMLVGSSFYMEASNNDYVNCYHELVSYRYYDDVCIGPNQTAKLISDGSVSQQYELNEYRIVCRGYQEVIETTYGSIKLEDKADVSGVNSAYYYFSIEDLKTDNEYYYSMIVDMNVKDKNVAFKYYSAMDEFSVCLNDRTLTEEDFTINGVYLIRGRNKTIDFINDTWTIVYVCLGVTLFVGFLVSLAFIPLIVKVSTKRTKKEDVTNN